MLVFSLVRTSSYKFLISVAEFRLAPVLTGEVKLLMRVAVSLLEPVLTGDTLVIAT